LDFLTLNQEAAAETEEKKSRFLAYVVPITSFEARLESLRAAHPKANHHVTASRRIHANNQIEESAKDDGEPSGTSGMPVLKLLIGRNMIDVGAIVVRYFGGTKLGTGGLARAYPGAVKAALDAAELLPWSRIVRVTLKVSFARASDLEVLITKQPLTVTDRRLPKKARLSMSRALNRLSPACPIFAPDPSTSNRGYECPKKKGPPKRPFSTD